MQKVLLKLFIVFIMFISSLCYADIKTTFKNVASKKEEYDLQERCNKRAEERFKNEYGNGLMQYNSELKAIMNYRTHYNRRLNTCFVLLESFFSRMTKISVISLKGL